MHQGGAEAMVVEHVRHAGAGVESLVVALNRGGPALEAAAAAGARALTLDKAAGAGGRWGAVETLARLIRREGVHLVNGHNPTGGLYASLAALRSGIPAVRTEHSTHFPGRHSPIYPTVEPLTTFITRRIICVCEAVRSSHASRMPWARDRFVTIPNGISPPPPGRSRDVVRAELDLLESDRLILAVGSLTRQKDHADLIEAFQRVARRASGVHLAIAGEGPLRTALERQVNDAGLTDRVRLLGARSDAVDLIAAADAFALASVREGLSITLLEAMRAGCPVVATRVGGSPEAIEHGASGWIVEPRDPRALSEALLELLGDPVHAAECARAARQRWRERFTAERMVADTEELYQEVLSGRGERIGPPKSVRTTATERAS
jgi:glycosyltransferase involved in cell wall biosynthesis